MDLARCLKFEVRPGAQGDGFEVLTWRGTQPGHISSYCRNRVDLLTLLITRTTEFYGPTFYGPKRAELEAQIDADPDVAGALCPGCEDEVLQKQQQTPQGK